MSVCKSKTKRELREHVFENGKPREMIIEIEDGYVTAWPKGTRQKLVVSIAGAWQHAVRRAVEDNRRGRKRR